MPSRFDIDIELYAIPDATAPDIAVLQAEIAQGLAELWPALGLPAEPVVSLRHSPEPFDLFDFSIQSTGNGYLYRYIIPLKRLHRWPSGS